MKEKQNANGTVLYIGTFKMPDKCAAAHRVKSVAKSLRDMDLRVVFFGSGETADITKEYETEGFTYYNVFDGKKGSFQKEMFDISHIKKFLMNNQDVKAIIAYNYPSVALLKLKKVCRKKKIALIADCTEWFDGKEKKSIAKYIKIADSAFRMKYVQKHIDGVIGISNYLCNYYEKFVSVVRIPATVDLDLPKYSVDNMVKVSNTCQFIYAGSPSRSKEQLDKVVDAFNALVGENVILKIVGITRERYLQIYDNIPNEKNIQFCGLVDHATSLSMVKESNCAMIVRPSSRVTNAGFPTKFAEAITCGTPVLATDTSDLRMYLETQENGLVTDIEHLKDSIQQILYRAYQFNVQRDLFDYRNYTSSLRTFMVKVGVITE